MEFLIENWYLIVIGICIIAVAILAFIKFTKSSNNEKYEQIRGWLLQAVILAEQEYGSGTGKMKLSAVYDAFCIALPWFAKTLSFELFSKFVDDALEEAKGILAKNQNMAALAETMIHNNKAEQVFEEVISEISYSEEFVNIPSEE